MTEELRQKASALLNRLSRPAQVLFARMSFFPGGLCREGDLWELLGDSWIDAAEELEHHGLVVSDAERKRYSLADSLTELARDNLDGGEGDDFRRRATEFWADYARWHDLMMDVRPTNHDHESQMTMQDKSFVALAQEEANLVHAAIWAMKAREESGLGIVDSLQDYLDLRNSWSIKKLLYESALVYRRQLADKNPHEYLSDVGMSLINMAKLHNATGEPQRALYYYKEAAETYKELFRRDPRSYAETYLSLLNNLTQICQHLGLAENAHQYGKEALEVESALDSQESSDDHSENS